jgi:hypothetical protein
LRPLFDLGLIGVMPSLSRRRGIVCAAVAAASLFAACSTTPHFINDLTGGSGGSAAHASSATSGTAGGGAGSTTTTTTTSSSGSVACVTVGDCGMIDTACAHPACTGGQCVVTLEPVNTPTPTQVPGDCKQTVCDGNGHVTTIADDGDAPDGGDGCTMSSCDGGTPVQTQAPTGASCGLVAGLKCGATGLCAGCTAGAQCGADGPCVTWKCASARCTPLFTAAGAGSPDGGSPGDCQSEACDGMGGVESIADSANLPASPSTCVMGACAGGVPTTQNAPAGTACPGGHSCDGAGHCGSCATDADCGATTVCGTPACVSGQCSGTYAPQGPAPQQVTGDCETAMCDGNGGLTQVPDNTDTPPPSDKCHIGTCTDGTPEMQAVAVPPSNTCNTYSCDPAMGIVDTMTPTGISCGPCLECETGVCVSFCALGCICIDNDICEDCP